MSLLPTKHYETSGNKRRKVDRSSAPFREFEKELEDFNAAINSRLLRLLRRMNEYFKQFTKIEHLEVSFGMSQHIFEIDFDSRPYRFKPPSVCIEIKYDNEIIKRPQIFLNEARLTALAFSIRFADFEQRLKMEEGLKIFVLDDILMSLDMSNRYLFFDFILNNEQLRDYQMIILTHERELYDLVAKMIEVYPNRNQSNWKQFELYENGFQQNGEYKNPTILTESLNHYDKAKAFFEIKDYPSCGNYQRKAAEREIKRILGNTKYILKSDGKEVKLKDQLNELFRALKDCCRDFDLDFTPFERHAVFEKIVLNKLSHDNLRSVVFRDELDEVFTMLDELKKIRSIKVASKNDKLSFEERSRKAGDGKLYRLVVRLTDDLVAFHQAASNDALRAKQEAITKLIEPVVEPIELWIDGVKVENPKLSKAQKIGRIHQFNIEKMLQIPKAEQTPYAAAYKVTQEDDAVSLDEIVSALMS